MASYTIRDFGFVTKRGFESFARKLTAAYVYPNTLVVDGGPHRTLYLMVSTLWGSMVGCLLLNLIRSTFVRSVYNIEKNECTDKVTLFPKALADSMGVRSFIQGKSSLSGSLIDRFDVSQRGSMSIQTTSLIEKLVGQKIDSLFVKLDLEGATQGFGWYPRNPNQYTKSGNDY